MTTTLSTMTTRGALDDDDNDGNYGDANADGDGVDDDGDGDHDDDDDYDDDDHTASHGSTNALFARAAGQKRSSLRGLSSLPH